jgi:parvulin-like peptidyl-prolyl isomerase
LSRPSAVRSAVLVSTLLLAGSGASCERFGSKDPVILTLGDQKVRRSEFERHVHELEARGGGHLDASVRNALFDPFVEERIVVLEARNRGLIRGETTPEEEQAAVQKLLASDVLSRVNVSDDEVTRYYQEHGAEFRISETVTLRQILVSTQTEAREVKRKLSQNPRQFDELARTHSRAPEAAQGGLMGIFARGELPAELEAAAFALPEGAQSDVVVSTLGYHILKLEARGVPRDRNLDECRAEIRSRLTREKADLGVRQFVQGLLARAKVNHEAVQVTARDS